MHLVGRHLSTELHLIIHVLFLDLESQLLGAGFSNPSREGDREIPFEIGDGTAELFVCGPIGVLASCLLCYYSLYVDIRRWGLARVTVDDQMAARAFLKFDRRGRLGVAFVAGCAYGS
jgi:hypothetical protein